MKRIFYYVQFENSSPIHVGTGDGEFTDLDVIKDKDGNGYIPGTSFTGSILHYLSEEEKELITPHLNGQNIQSPVCFSDAIMDQSEIAIENRDGIKLTRDKITEKYGKYDYQVIPMGCSFSWRIEAYDRDKDSNINNKTKLENIIEKVFSAIENEEIRIGFKTTRGLGKLRIKEVRKQEFDQSNFEDYIKFDPYNKDDYNLQKKEDIIEVNNSTAKIVIYLKQKGGISIRTYNTEKGAADFKHIYSAGKPVIPGASWNGLIRRCMGKYAEELGYSKEEFDIDYIFGCCKQKRIQKSKIYIEESVIEGGEDITLTRNRINPFTASTVTGALFKEITHYNGTTTLSISFSKDLVEKTILYERLILMIKLFANDLNEGFVALGGQTSIGRGMFDIEKVEVNGKAEDQFLQLDFK